MSRESVDCLPYFKIVLWRLTINLELACPVQCDVDQIRQKIEAQQKYLVSQIVSELSVIPQTNTLHLTAMGMIKKLETWIHYVLTETQRLSPLKKILAGARG